jgi:hypothetical protein
VFILKTVQVICFEPLLQVLILNNLRALVCTKIVQNIVQKGVRFVSVANKRVRSYEQSPESKNANQEIGVLRLGHDITQGILYAGGHILSREKAW